MEKNVEVEKFVAAVAKGKNIQASKSLEKVIQEKCAKKILDVLKNQ